ncbi:hypothetical protein QO016_001051 [Methylobacterium persicinum]|uniref:Uncharacterized protein n=1 Tax=Methylobacterium persicinum TaxID=374426 RepID=A0ABU0HIC3_9HYPH|nr:hypothetical protein [Methylobacterium persicinum]
MMPVTAFSFGVATAPPIKPATPLFVLLCLYAGAIIRLATRQVLGSLRPCVRVRSTSPS